MNPKFAPLIFFISLAALAAPRKPRDCNGLLSKTSATKFSEGYRSLRDSIASGYKDWNSGLLNTREGWATGFPKNLLNQLSGLTNKERKQLFELALKNDPQLIRTPLVVFVLLDPMNPAGWKALFDASLKDCLESGLLALDSVFSQMPDEAREYIFDRIAELYPNASKNVRGGNALLLGPKRALDLWIRELIRAPEIILRNYSRTRNAAAAYQAYIDQINRKIISRMPRNSKLFGRIKVTDMIGLARAAQSAMKKTKWGQSTELLLHGSVFKGLGKSGSDIDVMFKHKHLEAVRDYYDYGIDYREFMMVKVVVHGDPNTPAYQLDQYLQSNLGELNLQISEPLDTKTQFRIQSLLEPIFILVTAKEISLLLPLLPIEEELRAPDVVDMGSGLKLARVPLDTN